MNTTKTEIRIGDVVEYHDQGRRSGIVVGVGRLWLQIVGARARVTITKRLESEVTFYRRARIGEITERLSTGATYSITRSARRGLHEARESLRSERRAPEADLDSTPCLPGL